MSFCRKIILACSVLIGLVAVIIGIIVLTVIEGAVNKTVLSRDYLGYESFNGSKRLNPMTERWARPPYFMQLQVWMYDLVNEAEVLRGAAKPRVRQVGPFTFLEHQWKSPIHFDKNDSRVFYRNNHVYYFNDSLSCPDCLLSRRVTIPNVVFQKLVDFAARGYFEKFLVGIVLNAVKTESPFVNVTVEEALFKGYHDPLLDFICSRKVLQTLCDFVQVPKHIGFLYGQNGTDDGLYEVSTGLGDAFEISKVFTYNNLTVMPESTWDSADAREIRGTDGQLFPPFLQENQDLEIFAGPICRTVTLEFREKSEFRDVVAYRYALPSHIYDPSIATNRGFCNKNNTPTYFNSSVQIPGCLPKGFLDIGRCLPGAPRIYISQAHFLNSDREVQFSVDGMDIPDEANDNTFIEVEPTTGVPINVKRITQINVGMRKGNLRMTSNMNNVILPVLWMNETIRFDNGTRAQLGQLISIKRLLFVSGVSLLTVGLLIWFAVIVTFVVFTILEHRREDEQGLLQDGAAEEEIEDI
ncbi:CD36 [Parelaphostrongylus tenuis]|uniref:CD36 n=1 Tax=Parelaphostrongylus tenuis TaxID=148309 RepID=A0AAD5QE59_PARTN|nr:CD36 [Parelaphostrongylus tenuis]